jgi:hypothetical protein
LDHKLQQFFNLAIKFNGLAWTSHSF